MPEPLAPPAVGTDLPDDGRAGHPQDARPEPLEDPDENHVRDGVGEEVPPEDDDVDEEAPEENPLGVVGVDVPADGSTTSSWTRANAVPNGPSTVLEVLKRSA